MKNHRMKKFWMFAAVPMLVLFVMGTFLNVPFSIAQEDDGAIDSDIVDEVHLLKGEVAVVKVDGLTRLAVTDPEIVDVDDATDSEVIIVGKNYGKAALFIWDGKGKKTIICNVLEEEKEVIKKRLEKLFASAAIPVKVDDNTKDNRVIVSGQVPANKQDQLFKIMDDFIETAVDLTDKEEVADLIQIDVQVTELNTTLTKNLGIKWTSENLVTDSGSGETEFVDEGILNPGYKETLPQFDGSFGDLFKIGDFSRTSKIVFAVNALIEQGKAKILSKPQLVVVSGQEAKFLVGGEIPIRTTNSTSSGGLQENITFKEYGISMTMTPTIKRMVPGTEKDKVDVIVNIEISDIDSANAVGDDVAFLTRSASTRLLLDDQQTVILAGLIKHAKSETVRKVPFLGSIPIVGAAFRNRQNTVPDVDQELVISITPTVLHKNRNIPQADKDVADQKGEVKQIAMPVITPTIPPEMTAYVQEIQRGISQSIEYPGEAREYGWEGTVKLGLLILRDGTLAYALVKESSGYDIFDDNALNTAKKVAPYAAFPEETELQELNVTIPIVYSLSQK